MKFSSSKLAFTSPAKDSIIPSLRSKRQDLLQSWCPIRKSKWGQERPSASSSVYSTTLADAMIQIKYQYKQLPFMWAVLNEMNWKRNYVSKLHNLFWALNLNFRNNGKSTKRIMLNCLPSLHVVLSTSPSHRAHCIVFSVENVSYICLLMALVCLRLEIYSA